MSDDISYSGSMLDDDQRKAALARTASDWMAIYIEVVERDLKRIEQQHSVHGDAEIFSRWTQTNRPRLRRIGERFTDAGLVLDEAMEVSGVDFEPPNRMVFLTPTAPYATFHWPDESSLTFYGEEAGSAMGFFVWWVNFQPLIIGTPETPDRRIIEPGSPEHQRYMRAKARDQKDGLEPS